jgi:hypothetical protein
MRVDLNSRGNGACPLCAFSGNCHIQDTIKETLDAYSSESDPIELVIYSCPKFSEEE